MKTNDIILPVAAFALGAFIAKKNESAAVGSYKTFDIYKPITTRRQAFAFFRYLVYVEGLNFHIDDSFENMVNYKTGKRTFTDAKAKVLNSRMDEVFELLGEESYDIAMNIFSEYFKANQLDKIGNDIRFFVRPNFGHFSVIDNTTNKMWVGYGKKDKAQKTAAGLNAITDPIELQNMLTYLKTSEGYGHFVR